VRNGGSVRKKRDALFYFLLQEYAELCSVHPWLPFWPRKGVVTSDKNHAEKLIVCHMSLYNDTREDFLTKTAAIAPQGLNKIFFSNSGAEAVEAALKFSRRYTGKTGIISMNGGYHGKTFGALSVTYSEKYRKPFMPLLESVKFLPYTNPNIEDSIDRHISNINMLC